MASSEHFEYFVNFPLAGISLLFKIGYVVLRQVIASYRDDTCKTNSYRLNSVEERLKPEVRMFQPFCFNRIVTA